MKREQSHQQNFIKYDLKGVNNQYKIKGGERACIPISILTLYHLYRRTTKLNNTDDFLLSVEEWRVLLKRAVELFTIWEEKSNGNNLDTINERFPKIEEVLELEDCQPFCQLFDMKQVTDISGLVRHSNNVDNTEGTLSNLFIQIRNKARINHTKPVGALIIIPVKICISVLCKKDSKEENDYSFIIFDSHGGKTKEDAIYCELLQFFSPVSASKYIINKYNIESLNELDPYYRSLCSEDEIASNYAFCAKIFV
jgi:hypothetical protein